MEFWSWIFKFFNSLSRFPIPYTPPTEKICDEMYHKSCWQEAVESQKVKMFCDIFHQCSSCQLCYWFVHVYYLEGWPPLCTCVDQKCKLSWTDLFLPNTDKTVVKRSKHNKYEALHVPLYSNCSHKYRTLSLSSPRTAQLHLN